MVGFRVRGVFFDTPKVIKAVGDATYRALVRTGQYVRKVARHSIQSRPGPSRPGTPPHNQTGMLKGWILYSFDPAQRSVVVGPARLQNTQTYGPITVPEVLEYGGTVQGRKGPRRRYEARPYMGPAFERSHDKLDTFWRDSVRP